MDEIIEGKSGEILSELVNQLNRTRKLNNSNAFN